MGLVDSHCHIHEATLDASSEDSTLRKWKQGGSPDPDQMISEALDVGVEHMICVGTTAADSELATRFVSDRENCFASLGIHPHEASNYSAADLDSINDMATLPKVVAIGEIGLDYYYENSPRDAQKTLLVEQLKIAQQHELPVIFHVRDAFDDFWPIFDSFAGIKGVIHSFSASNKELKQILQRDLFVGLNGIMTFTKDEKQLLAAKEVPLSKLLLETDAPFLTPVPFRGTICRPKHVAVVAEFLSELRGESLEELATTTTANAVELFKLR